MYNISQSIQTCNIHYKFKTYVSARLSGALLYYFSAKYFLGMKINANFVAEK